MAAPLVDGFPACCGAKIFHHFGNFGSLPEKEGNGFSPSEIDKWLKGKIKFFQSQSFLIAILHPVQRVHLEKIFLDNGFVKVARGTNSPYQHDLHTYIRTFGQDGYDPYPLED